MEAAAAAAEAAAAVAAIASTAAGWGDHPFDIVHVHDRLSDRSLVLKGIAGAEVSFAGVENADDGNF